MKTFIKKYTLIFASLFAPKSSDGAIILMYHSVSDSPAFFVVKEGEFEKHLSYLKQEKCICVTLSELVRRMTANESLEKIVCLTFDDGYEDNHAVVLPLLEKYAIPATIFVSTDYIGKNRTTSKGHQLAVMSRGSLLEMSKNPLIELMPHGHMHERLSKMTESAVHNDIKESQEIIREITGKPANLFAYPYGDYSAATVKVISDLGFKAAVTVHEGTVSADSNLLELSRMVMTRQTTLSEFICKVSKPKAYLKIRGMLGGSKK